MIERPIFVELIEGNDSTKNSIIKVVRFRGDSLESLKNEIRKRFDLACGLEVKFAPKHRGDALIAIKDDYEVEGFFRSCESGMCHTELKVFITESDEPEEPDDVVCSNNIPVRNDLNVANDKIVDDGVYVANDLNRCDDAGDVAIDLLNIDVAVDANFDVVVDGNIDVAVDANFDVAVDDLGGIDDLDVADDALALVVRAEDVTLDETSLVECSVSTEEEGVLQLETFNQQLLALEACNDRDGTGEDGTEDGTPESSEPVPITFTDGSSIKVGQLFPTKKDASNVLSIVAMKGNFEYRTYKSDAELLILKCRVKSCTWRIRLRKIGWSEEFEVRTYNPVHTCALDGATKVHTNASYDIIANLFQSRFVTGKGPSPKEIQAFMEEELGCQVSYWRAWAGRNAAMEKKRGNFDLGYAVLPKYFNILKIKNPGTVTGLELDGENFLYCFVCYGASLHGFQYVRKVIAVDGTFLVGKYRGVLLCASAQDGNGQIYPLAVCVADSENDNSWKWFFERLKDCIPDNEELCFISDRHGSIKKGIAEVYPLSHHGCCTVHLWANCKQKFQCGQALGKPFKAASKAYTVAEFDRCMALIKNHCMGKIEKGKPNVYEYLVDAGVERWSRAHFPGNRYFYVL